MTLEDRIAAFEVRRADGLPFRDEDAPVALAIAIEARRERRALAASIAPTPEALAAASRLAELDREADDAARACAVTLAEKAERRPEVVAQLAAARERVVQGLRDHEHERAELRATAAGARVPAEVGDRLDALEARAALYESIVETYVRARSTTTYNLDTVEHAARALLAEAT